MPVTAARARRLALALAEASAAPHFDRIAFRTSKRIFATLGATGVDLNLMFDPGLQEFYCAQAPAAFAPLPNKWGQQGATRCELKRVDEATLAGALAAAHKLASTPKKRAKRG
jgi:hypothetical protein